MISWEDFKTHMHDVCLLVGQNPPVEQMKAIYRKIQDYELQDFIKACNDDQLLEDWAIRVNYPSLKRIIMTYQAKRLEAEHEEAQRREREELRKAIQSKKLPEEIRQFIQTFGR
ncbi:MAG: hypothetical protein QW561_05120 [Candidatus Aenigmatarchaeota archaeon]